MKDVAFSVDDCRGIYEVLNSFVLFGHLLNEFNTFFFFFLNLKQNKQKAISRGAESVLEPTEETDEHGTVILATVKTVSPFFFFFFISF